jgi:hypothetical protein
METHCANNEADKQLGSGFFQWEHHPTAASVPTPSLHPRAQPDAGCTADCTDTRRDSTGLESRRDG